MVIAQDYVCHECMTLNTQDASLHIRAHMQHVHARAHTSCFVTHTHRSQSTRKWSNGSSMAFCVMNLCFNKCHKTDAGNTKRFCSHTFLARQLHPTVAKVAVGVARVKVQVARVEPTRQTPTQGKGKKASRTKIALKPTGSSSRTRNHSV